MKKKKYIKMFLLVSLVAVVGLSTAYYTDHKANSNVFTTGKVSISLTEPKYNLAENVKAREDLAPLEIIIKDPKVTNNGKSDAYVFIELFMPRTDRVRIDDAGQKLAVEYRDAFVFTKNPEWVQAEREIVTVSGKQYYRYVYAYATGDKTTGSMRVLKKGQATTTLFENDELQHRNFIEIEGETQYDIPVKAYAIQTTDIGTSNGTSKKDPVSVWTIIKAQKVAEGVR